MRDTHLTGSSSYRPPNQDHPVENDERHEDSESDDGQTIVVGAATPTLELLGDDRYAIYFNSRILIFTLNEIDN